MASLDSYMYSSSDHTNESADNSTSVPTIDHNTSTLAAAIRKSDDKMFNLIEDLAITRRRFDASIGSDRILEHQYQATVYFLESHLEDCLRTTSDLNPGEFDSIQENISDQVARLCKIRYRIKLKELELAQLISANWKAVSGQLLKRDLTTLVFNVHVQQIDLP
ncbi:hypothetical protein Q9L58_004822 [Maublancomyces gigas]|uniref:Uncharacterized protein n=1 Tax=Discina gigas TaxID=1032678 RepID=A0ABR3GK73_9PEZI